MGKKSQVGRNASNCFISYCFKEAILFWQSRAKSEVLSILPYTMEAARIQLLAATPCQRTLLTYTRKSSPL